MPEYSAQAPKGDERHFFLFSRLKSNAGSRCDSGKRLLRSGFTVREAITADHDGDQACDLGHRASEECLKESETGVERAALGMNCKGHDQEKSEKRQLVKWEGNRSISLFGRPSRMRNKCDMRTSRSDPQNWADVWVTLAGRSGCRPMTLQLSLNFVWL